MLSKLCKVYSQGLYVAGCASMSILILGYLMDDIHKIEKNKIIKHYENKINKLN